MTDNNKTHSIPSCDTPSRNKRTRRNVLKTFAASGGAVAIGKSLPEKWTRPVTQSVTIPAHAATSVCELSGFFNATQAFENTDLGLATFGPFAVPGDYVQNVNGSTSNMRLEPQMSVTPGVNDSFNLVANISGGSALDAGDISQNVVPDSENGALPFTNITVGQFDTTVNITITPDNTELCGLAQNIQIEFND